MIMLVLAHFPKHKLDVSGTGRFPSTVVVGEPTGPTHALLKDMLIPQLLILE